MGTMPNAEILELKYGKLIDGSQITHSGRTVSQELARLGQPVFSAVAGSSRIDVDAQIAKLVAAGAAPSGALLSIGSLRVKQRFAAQKALVEPFLEPYSFLLEDLLETTDPASIRPNLIELASLFPNGAPQPAWADLVRTGYYYVLSDGRGYARIFVPGTAAATAYHRHLPVLRNVIAFLLASRTGADRSLKLDVYAYENDLITQTLRLHIPKLGLRLTEAPPTNFTYGSVNLGAIQEFLSQNLTLEGAALDARGQLVLIGARRAQRPTLEGQPVTMADMAAAYRAAFYAGEGEAFISLDPSPYAEQTNVNFGGRLQDTRLGWVLLRSDMRFKTIGDGYDVESGERLDRDLSRGIPGFLTMQMRQFSVPLTEWPERESTRFWFYPDNISVEQSADGTRMRIRSPRYTAAAERQLDDGGDDAEHTPPWTRDAIAHLNRYYEQYAARFQEIRELDNVGRLLALFTWLKQKKMEGKLLIDLDPLLAVELPRCQTPRRMPQLLVAYFASRDANPQVWAANMSDLAEQIQNSRPRSGALASLLKQAASSRKTPEGTVLVNWAIAEAAYRVLEQHPELKISPEELRKNCKSYGVVAGGIDAAPNPLLTLRRGMDEGIDSVLQRVVGSPGIPVNHAGEQWVRSPRTSAWRADVPPQPHLMRAVETRTGVQKAMGGNTQVAFELGENGRPSWIHRASFNEWNSNGTRTAHYGPNGRLTEAAFVNDGRSVRYRMDGGAGEFTAAPTARSAVLEEPVLQAVERDFRTGRTASEIWAKLPDNAPLAAFDRTPDNRVAVLYGDGGTPVLRYYRDGIAAGESRGKAAVADFESIGQERVRAASTGNLKFVFASGLEEDVTMQAGAKHARMRATEMRALMDNPRSTARSAIDGLFQPGDEVVVYRDALDRRPAIHGGSAREGKATDPVRLAMTLQERYPAMRVYLDDETELASRNHQSLAPIRSANDLAALVPEETFAVEDHDLLKRIKGSLSTAGVKLAGTGADLGAIPNVLMINGNNDPQLAAYLTELGERGFLQGRVILLNTCYARQNPNFFSELIAKYQPRAIFLHGEPVHVEALQRMVRELGPLLKEAEASGKPVAPADLLHNCVRRALADPSLSPRLRVRLESLYRGVLQISELRVGREEAIHA
jgi:hypothetical protein